MNRWRCDACAKRGQPEEWEDHRQHAFCQTCGGAATRIFEYGCFVCSEEGYRFWDVEAPSHACPQCGGDAYRVVYAPYLKGSDKKADYAAADAALVAELDRQKVSTTTLKRTQRKRDNPFAAHWADANQLLPRGGHGVGGSLPFGMPRPQMDVVGRDTRQAKAN